MRSLLLLKQSLRSLAADDGRMTFVDSDIDLGGFANVVHKHDSHENIELGVSFDRGGRTSFGKTDIDFSVRNGDYVTELRIGGELYGGGSRTGRDFLGTYSLRFREDSDDLDSFLLSEDDITGAENLLKALSSISNRRFKDGVAPVLDDQDELPSLAQASDLIEVLTDANFTRRNLFPTVRGARRIPGQSEEEAPEDFARRNLLRALDEFILAPSRLIEAQFRQVTHLAGLRAIPDRVTNVGTTEKKIKSDASNIVAILGSDRKIAQTASKLLSRLTQGAYELELIKLNDRSVDFLGDVGSLVLKDMRVNTTTTFKDVGVGLSQVLPIITVLAQAMHSRERDVNRPSVFLPARMTSPVVLLEQPELHLHPRMQAELADVILEASLARNSEAPQVIMETHSESIILRLQRRIREGLIKSTDVSVIFVDRDPLNGCSKITELELDSNGEFLTAWPESFGVIRLDEILP